MNKWRGGRRAKLARASDIAKTHVNSLVPRGSASVTTWRAIVQREVAAKIETMSAEWDREDTGGRTKGEEGGYRLNRKPSPEQLLHRRFTWPTFTASEVTLISLCVSAGARTLTKKETFSHRYISPYFFNDRYQSRGHRFKFKLTLFYGGHVYLIWSNATILRVIII